MLVRTVEPEVEIFEPEVKRTPGRHGRQAPVGLAILGDHAEMRFVDADLDPLLGLSLGFGCAGADAVGGVGVGVGDAGDWVEYQAALVVQLGPQGDDGHTCSFERAQWHSLV